MANKTEAQFQAAIAAHQRGDLLGAEKAYRKVLKRAPDNVPALSNCSALLQSLHRNDEAARMLEHAFQIAPTEPPIALRMATHRELSGNLEGAWEVAIGLFNGRNQDFAARAGLIAGRIATARGETETAINLLTPATRHPDTRLRIRAAYDIAAAWDKAGNTDLAFEILTQGKEMQKRLHPDWRRRATEYCRYVGENARAAENGWADYIPRTPLPCPIRFFVGFPRSGTTLVEQVLAAHPDTVTTGEISPFTHMMAANCEPLDQWPARIPTLTGPEIEAHRKAFIEQLHAMRLVRPMDRGRGAGTKVVIDKLPLNLIDLPGIARIIPEAEILVALRDPRDVCLSCYMQSFEVNDAMINFLDLDQTGRFYDATLKGFEAVKARIPDSKLLTYRYEDLTADPEAESGRITEFLCLAPEEDLLAPERRQGARIATPSSGARGAIHRKASGRWKRYEATLAPLLPHLDAWIGRFGYEQE